MRALGLILFSLLWLPPLAKAQLAKRYEQLEEQYQEDRIRGLVLLNRRYLKSFQEELQSTVQSGKLDKALRIKEIIKGLETEIAALEKKQNEDPSETKTAEELLAGKILEFAHEESTPDRMYYFRFVGKGEAYWLEFGNASVTREYKPTDNPREVELWWPARPGLNHYFITPSEDGKSAVIRFSKNNYVVTGKLFKDRGDLGPKQ